MAIQQLALVDRLPANFLTRAQRNVLEALAKTARPDGTGIFAGNRTLARRAHVCTRVFLLHRRALEQKQLLLEDRHGGGRSGNGNPRRSVWRLNLENVLLQLRMRGFAQGFPQNVHNGDRLITVNGDRSITVNGDRLITQAADRSVVHAAGCPVGNDPIRPVRTPSRSEYRPEGKLDLLSQVHEDDVDRQHRQQLLEQVRHRMSMARVPGPVPRPRRRAAS